MENEKEKNMLSDLISTLTYYEKAEALLNDILSYYDIHNKQFKPIDMYRIPPNGNKSAPRHLWKSSADDINNRIRKHINYDDSE